MAEKHIEIADGLVQADYNFWVGLYMDKFYNGLSEKKVIGNKCPKCSKTYLPPRKICGECFQTILLDQNMVELKEIGTLLNFTTTYYQVTENKKRTRKTPLLIGMVQIDGSNSAIVYPILNAEEKNLTIGMKMQLVWNERIKGLPSDIKGFSPVGTI